MILWSTKRKRTLAASSYDNKRQLQIQRNNDYFVTLNSTPDEQAWKEKKKNLANALVPGVEIIPGRYYVPARPQDENAENNFTYDYSESDVVNEVTARNLMSEFGKCGADHADTSDWENAGEHTKREV